MNYKILFLVLISIGLVSCGPSFEDKWRSKLDNIKEVKQYTIPEHMWDNELKIKLLINKNMQNYSVGLIVFEFDSSFVLYFFHDLTIMSFKCRYDTANHFETYSQYGCYLGKNGIFSREIEIRSIEDFINKIEVIDSLLNTLNKYPEDDTLYYREFNNEEEYYVKIDTSYLRKTYKSFKNDSLVKFQHENCLCKNSTGFW